MQPSLPAVVALVFLPFLAAVATPLVHRFLGERTAYYAAAVAAACFGLVASQYGADGTVSIPWIPTLDVELRFYVDGLALLIGFLASGIGFLILVYSRAYMHGEPGGARYYAALLAFLGSMLGVAFAADLIALFVFWELTSISSFVLIGHYRKARSSRYAARKAMFVTVSGGLFMLAGFLLLHDVTGTFDLAWMLANADLVGAGLREEGLYVPVLVLVAIGAAAKSAQVPLHVWLPNAMEAPTPVSAFLHSATMVKAGIYLIGRFRPLLEGEAWALLFVSLGLLTMTVAAVLAVAATDIKELLAYSTASHLGLIVAGFGFTPALGDAAARIGAEAGSLHILNHALFKAALFLVAGIVAHEAGTRAIDGIGGLRRDLPVTAGITAIAALGMAGVPPFNGFYSKELLFEATYDAALHAQGIWWLLPAVAVFGSIFTFLYSMRFLMLFFGERPDGLTDVHRPPLAMLAPPAVLAVLAAVVSVAPDVGVAVIAQRTFEGVGGNAEMHVGLPTYVSPPVLMSAATIVLGIVAYPFYDRLQAGVETLLAIDPLRANWYYDGAVDGLERLSHVATPLVHTGLVRTYSTWVLAGTSALALLGYVATGTTLPPFEELAASTPMIVVLLAAIGAALAIDRAPSHVAGVLTLSILGFVVAVFFVLASAPDLALTQLVVETLLLVIFLLVLDRLPAFYGETRLTRTVRDAALALVVGATVAATVLVTTAASPDSIADFFVENAIPRGGGGNVVNVVLVDFRAFDTLGEITVVAMAAISVLTLVRMREVGP